MEWQRVTELCISKPSSSPVARQRLGHHHNYLSGRLLTSGSPHIFFSVLTATPSSTSPHDEQGTPKLSCRITMPQHPSQRRVAGGREGGGECREAPPQCTQTRGVSKRRQQLSGTQLIHSSLLRDQLHSPSCSCSSSYPSSSSGSPLFSLSSLICTPRPSLGIGFHVIPPINIHPQFGGRRSRGCLGVVVVVESPE